ncbi:MAG: hypothetical protein IJ429_06095 [Lachnospiraceae bacterium]|nr:hypothetical protein [Lachnospiraceae bacterium]
MFVAYTEKYNQDNIETCMKNHVYDAPVWYDRDYMTLEEKKGKYYIYLSIPAKATGYSRYTRTYRLYFTEKGIRAMERISFFAVMMYVFFIPIMFVCSVGMLLTGDIFMSLVCLTILVLSIWLFGIKNKKNILNFLSGKMEK